jgi:chorismate dehydratase
VSPYAALHGLRIGCVQYLNSKPLIHDYDAPITLAHPSELARQLSDGRLDAALVPVFEALHNPNYSIVDEVAIASDGPVHSVFLVYRGPLNAIRNVAFDPASLTSANLLRVLMAEYHGIDVQADPDPASSARLLIGNQAIEFRSNVPFEHGLHILDLGAEWQHRTGMPFVFAVWALRPGLQNAGEAAAAFRTLKSRGLARRDEIIARDTTGSASFRRSYLHDFIRFDLGPREKAGLAEYRRLLARHGRISAVAAPLHFI